MELNLCPSPVTYRLSHAFYSPGQDHLELRRQYEQCCNYTKRTYKNNHQVVIIQIAAPLLDYQHLNLASPLSSPLHLDSPLEPAVSTTDHSCSFVVFADVEQIVPPPDPVLRVSLCGWS